MANGGHANKSEVCKKGLIFGEIMKGLPRSESMADRKKGTAGTWESFMSPV
jgi:hypothetical protein